MARKVVKINHGPFELAPQDMPAYICMCGLSRSQPFCDGSHKKTLDEEDGKIYVYAEDGTKQECVQDESGCCGCC